MLQDDGAHEIDTSALVALGANIASSVGAPAATLRAALAALPEAGLRVVRASRLYATPCFPAGSGPDYVNAAVVIADAPEPEALLARLHALERRFGRVRAERWGRRALDLDLLAHGAAIRPDAPTQTAWRGLPEAEQARRAPDRLILPHPRLQDRGFVLIPLVEVAPDWCHPITGDSVAAMLARIGPEKTAGIRPL